MYNLRSSKDSGKMTTPKNSFKTLVKSLSEKREGAQSASAVEGKTTPISAAIHTPRRLYLDTLREEQGTLSRESAMPATTEAVYTAPPPQPSQTIPTDATVAPPHSAINNHIPTAENNSPQLIAYVSSPSDIPLFRGFATDTDPPRSSHDKFNPEYNIKSWLQRIDLFFAATNITDDHARKHKLLTFTSPKFGDGRVVIQNFLDPTYDTLTYEDLKRQLIAIYDPKESSQFIEAAQAFKNCVIPKKKEQIAANVANIEKTVRNTVRTFFDRMEYRIEAEKRRPEEICEELLASILTANFFARKVTNKVVLQRHANSDLFTFYNDLRNTAHNSTKDVYAEELKTPESVFALTERRTNIVTARKSPTSPPRWAPSKYRMLYAPRRSQPTPRPPPPPPPTYSPHWRTNTRQTPPSRHYSSQQYPIRPHVNRPWRNTDQNFEHNRVKSSCRQTYAK